MASFYKPTYTRAVPPHAKTVTVRGVKCVRWTQRGGREVTAPVSERDPSRCLVESSVFWIEYQDAAGKRCYEKAFRDERASLRRKLDIEATVERIKVGDLPTTSMQRKDRPLSELLGEWEEHLTAQHRTDKYVAQTVERVSKVTAAIKANRVVDITAQAVEKFLARMRGEGENYRGKKDGWSAQTSNHYLTNLKGFVRWLVDHDHLERNPLAKLKKLNADAARAFERRALSDEDFWRFIDTTAASEKVWRNLPGIDRAMCYLTSAFTGLRLNELARLTPRSFQPHGKQYLVVLPAGQQKNRKAAPVFLPSAVADRLRPYLASKSKDEPLWDAGCWARTGQASFALYQDLAAAKIPFEDEEGKRFDFHALRSHFITTMLLKGVPLPQAQKLARLSTPAILMKHYAKLGLGDLAAEAEKLNPPAK
jgi:site-specific recombinase XerC